MPGGWQRQWVDLRVSTGVQRTALRVLQWTNVRGEPRKRSGDLHSHSGGHSDSGHSRVVLCHQEEALVSYACSGVVPNFCGYWLNLFDFSGKPSLTSSQSVSFRPGTNVEFNSPDFPSNRPATGVIPAGGGVAPLDGYSLDTLSNKNTDFSNPMYDAVQSGTTDPSISNGSGRFLTPTFRLESMKVTVFIPFSRNIRGSHGP